jgi:hypothetical protein
MPFATGKKSKAISDRSGMEFPYPEMVKEWNGSLVHYTEYEPKHPQLEPKPKGGDAQGLQDARPARTEPAVARVLDINPLILTSGSSTVSVFEEAHGRSTGNIVRFRDGEGGYGIGINDINDSNGHSITVTDTDHYTWNAATTATQQARIGGGSISAGPVTLTP